MVCDAVQAQFWKSRSKVPDQNMLSVAVSQMCQPRQQSSALAQFPLSSHSLSHPGFPAVKNLKECRDSLQMDL